MMKSKLLVYSHELSSCSRFESVFNTEFTAVAADTANQFVSKIKRFHPDAAVVCFCSAHEEDALKLLQLDALAGPLPLLACSKALSPDFIAAVAQQGVNRFNIVNGTKPELQGPFLRPSGVGESYGSWKFATRVA